MTFKVARIYEAREDMWAVEFSDGVTLQCARGSKPRVDALVSEYAKREGDGDYSARIQAMAGAVRDYETRL